MNEELQARLRAFGADGPGGGIDVDRLVRSGRRARRTRVGFAAGGSAGLVAGFVALALSIAPGHGGQAVVVGPAAPAPTASPGVDTDAAAHNAAILQKALPEFAISSRSASGGLRPDNGVAGPPDGWTATASLRASIGKDPTLGNCSGGSGGGGYLQMCDYRTLSDGTAVAVRTAEYSGSTTQKQGVTVWFVRPDGVQAVAQLQAIPPAADGNAGDNANALAWARTFVDRLGAVVTDANVEPGRRFVYDPDAAAHDEALFASHFGPDFDQQMKGNVQPGSAAAAGLPKGFTTMTFWGLDPTGEGNCGPVAFQSQCVAHTTADGLTVQERRGHFHDLGAGGQAQRTIDVYYNRPDGLTMMVELRTTESGAGMTTAREAAAQAWLEGLVDKAVAAATDPGFEPDPQSVAMPIDPDTCGELKSQGRTVPPACSAGF